LIILQRADIFVSGGYLQGGHALWKSGKPGKLGEFDNSGKIGEMSGNFCCAQGILTVSLVCYAAILQ
jgi:hypothetical protein